MTQTKKLLLLLVAIIVFGCFACVFWYVVINVWNDSTREPTRQEWAQMPRGDGKYVIGNNKEMAAGKWITTSNKYGCSWSIYFHAAFASPAEPYIERGSGKSVVISEYWERQTTYFETKGCGTWKWQGWSSKQE